MRRAVALARTNGMDRVAPQRRFCSGTGADLAAFASRWVAPAVDRAQIGRGMSIDWEALVRLQEESSAARTRSAVLRAEALRLAMRFGLRGDGETGDEIAEALSECVKAHDIVQGDRVALERRQREIRGLDVAASNLSSRLHADRRAWLTSAKARLLLEAAKVHREAEVARRAGRMEAARRLFSKKNRFEFVAGALGDVAEHEYGGGEPQDVWRRELAAVVVASRSSPTTLKVR